ncbi:ABC transporter substrate-binding protein [Sporosarcina sp. G11-34]|uniref:ABC transporter substrate-binding protein n=1 Tax=Sporosarcina sp. G11-34 TaxID=2849605 RepID=UPI0022A8D65F|nr:ABC transporter substrate-binding protein [Sporosarcina sp. G11-34]MCZ2257461.1 ABC transporter substrate-binding protein [Sporosarcina sp. G11-34]
MNESFKKWSFLSFVFVFMLAFMTACGTDKEPNNAAEESLLDVEASDEVVESFPITFTDDVGREVTIESEPESIVSIQTSNTEILYALGAGNRMIGVSDYCNYPEEALSVQKVGGQDMDAELVLSLLPDIAFVTKYHHTTHEAILKQYEDAGITVVVTGSPTSFEEVYQTMEVIAKATGTTEEAEKIIDDMKERHAALQEKAKDITDKKKVWVEVSPAPDIFTTGKNTFMHEMLESIHATNAAEGHEGWVKLTEEEIVVMDPDVIITTYGYYVDNPAEGVLAREGWEEVPAIKNEQVFDVDSDTVTRPGPRLIEGVENLAKIIYPEVFGE